MMEAAREVRVT